MLQRNKRATNLLTAYRMGQIMFSLFQLLVIATRDTDSVYQAFDPFRALVRRRDARR
jgi:hypothetical protein